MAEPKRLLLSAQRNQIKTRDRVRDLAEVYTHVREVHAMLDLVPDMFPSAQDPSNHDRRFLEPACGSGNFLEEVLRRKLTTATTARYGRGERYEHRILRCLASTYGIDIDDSNVAEARERLRALVVSHVDRDNNTAAQSEGFWSAVNVILATNIISANTLADAAKIEFIEYHPGRTGFFIREWSVLEEPDAQLDLFGEAPSDGRKDAMAIHFSQLIDQPMPTRAKLEGTGRGGRA